MRQTRAIGAIALWRMEGGDSPTNRLRWCEDLADQGRSPLERSAV
jgi:hypothetical protein